jgi:hypothetical protein
MKKSIAHLSIAALSLSFAGNALAAWQEIGQNEHSRCPSRRHHLKA